MGYSHGVRWTEEEIKKRVLEVVEFTKINRMPSRSEIEQYYNNTALTNAISRRAGGWYKLAKDLGLPIKYSETLLGKTQEHYVQEKLISMGYQVNKMPQNFPYDLLVNGTVKIDVKASRLYRGENGNFYTFHLEKPYSTCDIYVLRLLNNSSDCLADLVIPSAHVPTNKQISVGEKSSKYYKYNEKWEYIQQYSSFFRSVC